MGFDYPCIECDPTPDDERLRSVSFGFGPGGRDYWHDGPTIREATETILDNAKRYDIEPEYQGRATLV